MISFKKVGIEDVEILQKLSIQTFTESFAHLNNEEDFNVYLEKAFSIEALKQQIKNTESSFFFVKDGEVVCGYFKINIGESQTELKETNGLELERIYILANNQNKKIGNEIINEVKRLAIDDHKKYIWLGVWELNTKAIRFYERLGFKKFDTHVYPIGNDHQLDWMMKLML